jgi:hypothetical protein
LLMLLKKKDSNHLKQVLELLMIDNKKKFKKDFL